MLYKNFAEKLLHKAIDLRECSKATEDEAMWHTSDEITSLVSKLDKFYQGGYEYINCLKFYSHDSEDISYRFVLTEEEVDLTSGLDEEAGYIVLSEIERQVIDNAIMTEV